MLAKLLANLRESLLLGVVQAQTLLIASIERCESAVQCADEKRDVTLAMGIGGRNGNARQFLSRAVLGFIAIERFESAASADGVNMALSENGAEPGFQGAAAVKITEKRAFAAVALLEAIELRKKRIREFQSLRRSRAATQNRGSGRTQIAAIGCEEMLPRGFTIFEASGGKSKILEVQGTEIGFQPIGRQTSAGQTLFSTTFEGNGKRGVR